MIANSSFIRVKKILNLNVYLTMFVGLNADCKNVYVSFVCARSAANKSYCDIWTCVICKKDVC